MRINELYPQLNLMNNHKISKVTDNSKEIIPGSIFVAIKGYTVDGNNYIEEAIEKGANTIITENHRTPSDKYNLISSKNTKKELAVILNKLYYKKLTNFKIIGITGTNGKTTCTNLLYQYLLSLNNDVICFSSNGNYINNSYYKTTNTTPNIKTIYDLILKAPFSRGYIVMEISSQAISEMRVFGFEFDLITITNITQDHLDYHENFTDYLYTKARLMYQVKKDGAVLLNYNSQYFNKLYNCSFVDVYTFGNKRADFTYEIIETSINHTLFFIDHQGQKYALQTNLIGEINVQNITTVFGLLSILNINLDNFSNFIQDVKIIDGRLNIYNFYNRTFIIDYAHTPDAVEKILKMLQEFNLSPIKLLIGCGGNRDRTKRPLIGQISCKNANFVYFTEDNSREEETSQIIKEIICDLTTCNYMTIESRYQAIKRMIKDSQKGDTLVLLGMGNDKYITNYKELTDLDMVILALKELGYDR